MSNDVYFLIEHLQGKVMDTSFVLAAAARSAVQDDGKVIAEGGLKFYIEENDSGSEETMQAGG